jgi:hypothetical protein
MISQVFDRCSSNPSACGRWVDEETSLHIPNTLNGRYNNPLHIHKVLGFS